MNDLINSLFEAFAGVFILLHCRATYRAKSSAGVSLIATAFFFVWGAWNIYYYPSLGQTLSFIGGLGVFFANLLWIATILYYRRAMKPVRCEVLARPEGLEPPAF